MAWIQRLRSFFGREELERQIDDELRFHLSERIDELTAGGMSETEARRQAQIQFGSYGGRKEEVREVDLFSRVDAFVRDVRFGARNLRKSPAFTVTAVVSLALGIGANTAIFSIINALMLRSLPVADPARLVQIRSTESGDTFTNPIWEQLRDHQRAFPGMLAWGADRFDLSQGGESRFARGLWVSGDFFRVLGVPALRGRVFTGEEDRRGTAALAVVSYNFWKRNFPHDADVIGKTLHLNRHAFTVVGVTPQWFSGLEVDNGYDIAIPIACDPILHTDHSMLDERSGWWLQILGRLAPGASLEQTEAQLNTYATSVFQQAIDPTYPLDDRKGFLNAQFRLRPAATGFSDVRVRYKTALFTLMGTAALVLLITCANLANLLLARSAARQRELAVRLALGASRMRVILQLLTESLLLSFAGTAAGFVVAIVGSRLLLRLISTTNNPVAVDLSPDLNLLVFSAAAAILTAVLFGLAPAFQATRGNLNPALKENARGSVAGASRFRFGKTLVAAQIALSLILLVAAGLFLGTLKNLLSTDLGFRTRGVLLVNAQFQENAVAKERRPGIAAEIVSRLRKIPGVESAASSLRTPITNIGWNAITKPEGYRSRSRMDTLVWLNRVSPGYFSTLKTPLLIGRDFTNSDSLAAPRVIIIGEAAARHFFGFGNPIGKTIDFDPTGDRSKKNLYRIVGVVKDSKYSRINEPESFTGFVASGQDQDPDAKVSFELRSALPVSAVVDAVRAAIVSVTPSASLEFRDLETQVNESVMQPRVVALLSTVFGSLALMLAAIGLYGITAYGVSRRRNEIGIRIALGAKRSAVIRLALQDVVMSVVAGIVLGLVVSLALGRFVRSLLYGVQANDPAQIAAAAGILSLFAFVAAYLPARQAARLDPIEALREE